MEMGTVTWVPYEQRMAMGNVNGSRQSSSEDRNFDLKEHESSTNEVGVEEADVPIEDDG